MVLSVVQQAVVSVVLVLCVFVAMPRIFGGGGGRAGRSPRGGKAGPGHYDPRQHRRGRSRGGARGRAAVRSSRRVCSELPLARAGLRAAPRNGAGCGSVGGVAGCSTQPAAREALSGGSELVCAV